MALYTASVKRIIHSGWLYKESGGLFKRWHRRWFVLTDSTLLYYSDERENMRGDEIDIAVSEDCSLPPLKGKNHVMQIRVTIAMQRDQRSQFVLASDTAEDLLMWKKRISEVRQSLSSSLSISNLPIPADARPKLPPPPPPPAARASEPSAGPLNPTPAAVQSKKRDIDAREPPAVTVSEQDTSQSAFSSHRRSGSGLDGKQGGKSAFSTQRSSVVLNAPPTALPDVVGLGDNLEREMGSDDDDLFGLSDTGGPAIESDGAFVLDTKRRDLELEIKAMQSWLLQKDGDTEESEQLKANLEAKHAELNVLRKPAPLEQNNPVRSVMKRAVHSRRQRRLGSMQIPIIDFESLEPVNPVTTEREGVVPSDGGALSGGEYPSSAISKPVPKVQLLKLRKSIVSSNHFQESGRNKGSQASLIDIIAADNLTADELLDLLQQEDCSGRHVAVPTVHMLLQHVREQLMSEVGETLHSRELLIQQQAMISAQEHYSAAIEDMRERQALELQEMQNKLSQSYDDHVAAIAELSIARTTLESFREESAFAQRQHAEIVDSLRTQLEEALSDVEAASAFRFRVRDDANEEIKAAHRELFAMERRLLQLQSESSENIRQLSDEMNHLHEDKSYLEERLKIAISSMAPLRSMASSSSPPSMYSLSNEPDSKHSTRRDDRRGGHSSPNSISHSYDREGSPHSDAGGKFSRHALLALERRAALAEAGLKQAELREAAAAESYASQLLAANSAKDDEASAREQAERELHAVSESKRQLMLQLTILEREHTEMKQNLRLNHVALARAQRASSFGHSPSSSSFTSPRASHLDMSQSAAAQLGM